MVLLALTCQLELGAQSISNVRAAQRAGTKLVDVYYDLSGPDGAASVVVSVSSDGGSSYAVPATSFSGDVGGGVPNGSNRHFVWNAGADWDGQFSEDVRFRIVCTAPQIPNGFALIPAGDFIMGPSSADSDIGGTRVSVYVGAIFIAKYEVTKSLWDQVRSWGLANGYTDLPTGGGKAASHPVQNISWYSAVKWCNARSERDGLTPCYVVSGTIYKTGSHSPTCDWSASGYRLPTEAEWEKSARGGLSGRRFPWGNVISHAEANYNSYNATLSYDNASFRGYHPDFDDGTIDLPNSGYTSPVGSFSANGYGLYDMAGNVGEWCWNSLVSSRATRGGNWYNYANYCRVASRVARAPSFSDLRLGFRPARSADP